LPGDSQKVDEAVIINLEDYSIRILEKKYEVNGEDKFYISTMLLETDCELSSKEKAKIFKKASESFSKKHFVDEVETSQKLSRAITEGIENRETIDVTEVAEHVFRDNNELKQSFMEHVERVGLKDKRIEIDMEAAQKVFKKHKIKTDEGIEISIPYEYYMDKDKLEVIKNSDGTVSILIKNVNRVTSQ
jgi:PHD/YefM family antitoxin component YafN of YafNO toxin-antitoxin module